MVIGGDSDVITSLVSFISDAHLPHIGYDSTLSDLTTNERYSYFVRALPSDQSQAMVGL